MNYTSTMEKFDGSLRPATRAKQLIKSLPVIGSVITALRKPKVSNADTQLATQPAAAQIQDNSIDIREVKATIVNQESLSHSLAIAAQLNEPKTITDDILLSEEGDVVPNTQEVPQSKEKQSLGMIFIPNDINRVFKGRDLLEPIQANYHNGELIPDINCEITLTTFEPYTDPDKCAALKSFVEVDQDLKSYNLGVSSANLGVKIMNKIELDFPYDLSNPIDDAKEEEYQADQEYLRQNPKRVEHTKPTPSAVEKLKEALYIRNRGKVVGLGPAHSLMIEILRKHTPESTDEELKKQSIAIFNRYSGNYKQEEQFTPSDIAIYKEYYSSILQKENEFVQSVEELKKYYIEETQKWEANGRAGTIPEPNYDELLTSEGIMLYPGLLAEDERGSLDSKFYYASKKKLESLQTLNPEILLEIANIELARIEPMLTKISAEVIQDKADNITEFEIFMKRIIGTGEFSDRNIKLNRNVPNNPHSLSFEYQKIVFDEILKHLFQKYAALFPNNNDILLPNKAD
jgi:hypothetical protein